MFTPKTDRLQKLAKKFPNRIEELEVIFNKKTNVYIDYANVLPWAKKLQWDIDLKRLKQLFDSFDTINEVKFYYGTLQGNLYSEQLIKEVQKYHYSVTTKPVKIYSLSINTSSISSTSADLLKDFIRKPLLKKFKIEHIEYLNNILKELNIRDGVYHIQDRKCNFDVEIGIDMLLDYHIHGIQNFILWSGDSDFVDPIGQLVTSGKSVSLFATVRKVATELNDLIAAGELGMYDIQKIREFICHPNQMICGL